MKMSVLGFMRFSLIINDSHVIVQSQALFKVLSVQILLTLFP